MATTPRISFAVFRDEPDVPVVDGKSDHHPPTSTTYTIPPSGPLLVYAPDKENVDPNSGARALSDHALGKKRKTTLALKSQPTASPSKKLRPLAEKPNKRSVTKARSSDKKPKRVVTLKRTGSILTRREPSLPRLEEETETSVQAVIDSKCKDLTVLPLADISEAYEQAPAKEDTSSKIIDNAVEEKAASASGSEVVERAVTPPPTLKETISASHVVSPSALSTPERKRIYSAFTFCSPSPASKRLADARGVNVAHLSDVVF